jgi:D-3-phosphoglycerate dehydrogenase / 2-oxoglutarate reductase
MFKVLVTTVPFSVKNRYPLDLLEKNNIEYLINPLNKKLTEDELSTMVSDVDIIIAGTEPITQRVIDKAPNLKMISRVGIGLDSVALEAAKKRNITVSYTPDAPAPAVSELTIGLMLNLLRFVQLSNSEMHKGVWHRFFGRRLSNMTIGIIGFGRIGKGVFEHLKGFGNPKILINDVSPNNIEVESDNIFWATKEEIYQQSDVITIHTPLTVETKNLIQKEQLLMMKSDAILINTARGGIINEMDLYKVMESGHLSGAAIDVFDFEPYQGNLKSVDRCILTAHMGSMSVDCRTQMEIEATEEVVRFVKGDKLESIVPEEEYLVQMEGL